MEEKRKNYCRACGENTDHNFSGCTNARGLREIIRIQDGQLTDDREQEKRIGDLQGRLEKVEGSLDITNRIFRVLLDYCEVLIASRPK